MKRSQRSEVYRHTHTETVELVRADVSFLIIYEPSGARTDSVSFS